MLAEFGGPATLSKAWTISLLKRMNFTKRRNTTKCSMPPENFIGKRESFYKMVKMEDIPPELIFNSGLSLVPGVQANRDERTH